MDSNNPFNNPTGAPSSPFNNSSFSSLPPSSPISSTPPKKKLPLFLKIVPVVLVLAGLGVGSYFLFFNKDKTEGPEVPTVYIKPTEIVEYTPPDDISPEDSYESALKEKAESSTSESESFDYEMAQVNLMIYKKDYTAALEKLNSFNPSSLSAEFRYMLYNTYVNYYESTGEKEKKDEYYALAVKAREEFSLSETK